ncbi:MAG TPA: peroxiredoxin [Verrucomicrobiae bacterium]|jgi:peroxiredoxin Q/BCP
MKNIFTSSLLALSILFTASAALADMPKAGDAAPAFVGKDQDGKDFNLSSLIGKKIVLLYFYPKDFTGGCTKEACGFRDRVTDLQKDNVQVVGVSFDTQDSHQKFIAKYNLNFPLLADPDGKIGDQYGVRMAGKNLDNRVSFLIGLDGKIVHVTSSGNPEIHFTEMKAAIAGLKS